MRLTGPSTVLFLCLFTSQAALLVLSPILPEVAREFGVSTATAGQLRVGLRRDGRRDRDHARGRAAPAGAE